jgi:Tol biopolymer transport system component
MNSFLIGPGLTGVLRLVSSTLLAAWVGSPMSWSPEGEWLTYTVVSRPAHDRIQPGWLFDVSHDVVQRDRDQPPIVDADTPQKLPSTPDQTTENGKRKADKSDNGQRTTDYQLWATNRDCRQSVLIAHSESPLSAPAWSPLGRTVAYGRFVPQSIGSGQPVESERGCYEVVVQNGLDHSEVVWSSSDFLLDPETRAAIPRAGCAWSPDGAYLAISRPGRRPSVVIVRVDSKKQVHTLEHAILPAWSPDGRACAYIHSEDDYNTLAVVQRDGPNFAASRQLVATGRFTAPVYWSADGRSVYVILEKSRARSHEPELARVFAESGDVVRIPALASDRLRSTAPVRGLVLDLDRDGDRFFYSVDLEGRDTDVVWSALRERLPVTFKRFHPLDYSQRVAAIAGSPDGRLLAIRLATADGFTPPVVIDPETEQTTLIVPDDAARREWLCELAATAARLLRVGLPPAHVDGAPCVRPTLLPLPDEMSMREGVGHRVSRLARHATGLLERSPGRKRVELAQDDGDDQGFTEARLAFSYLQGDFDTAAAELERLEHQVSTVEHRFALLGLRAQILWSRGDILGARTVINFLVAATAGRTQHVDETPLGLVLTPNPSPGHDWARFLASKAAESTEPSPPRPGDPIIDPFEPIFRNPFGAPDGVPVERGAGEMPFAPIFPDLLGRDLDRLFAPEAPDFPKFKAP